jgi:hypothetical protein
VRARIAYAIVLLAGCRQILGIDEARLFDAGLDDANMLPDASPCVSLNNECVSADVLRSCTAIGLFPVDTACAWGCVMAGNPHCGEVVPSGGGVKPEDLASNAMLLDATAGVELIIDTDTGRIGTAALPSLVRNGGMGVNNGIDFQVRGNIGVFRVASLVQSAPTTITGSRGLAIVANGDITVTSNVDVRGSCTTKEAGPGGFSGGSSQADGSGTGAGKGALSGGGGGGGYGGRGGGVNGTMPDNRYGDALITVLVGGSGGGGGALAGGGVGGGGGGAIQISATGSFTLASTGSIRAAGGIGFGSTVNENGQGGGGGGGAGGAILLESPMFAANGSLDVIGGDGGQSNAGAGGSGATQMLVGGEGSIQDAPREGGGGGGGASGRIRINAPTASCSAAMQPAPACTTGTLRSVP